MAQSDSEVGGSERPNSEYQIPFDYATGIKPLRSGLLRGSSGTGRNRGSVTHLIAKEPFEEGRLSRDANTFLCDPNSSLVTVEDGKHEQPREVTCKSCLDLMERWLDTDN